MDLKGENLLIYMAFALYCEARPFIDYLNLKKDKDFEKFQLFRSDTASGEAAIILFITGTGSIHASTAAAYVFAKLAPGPDDLFINFGVCAGNSINQKGKLYRINSIWEETTGRWFYPDLILSVGHYEEASLATVPKVVQTMHNCFCDLADMEGAALYQTGQLFFSQHQMAFFKAVFDIPGYTNDADDRNAAIREVEHICARCVPGLMDNIKETYSLYRHRISMHTITFTESDLSVMETVSKKLKATAQMQRQLQQILYYEKLNGKDIGIFLDDFFVKNDFEQCRSKKEGMEWLNKLRETLWI